MASWFRFFYAINNTSTLYSRCKCDPFSQQQTTNFNPWHEYDLTWYDMAWHGMAWRCMYRCQIWITINFRGDGIKSFIFSPFCKITKNVIRFFALLSALGKSHSKDWVIAFNFQCDCRTTMINNLLHKSSRRRRKNVERKIAREKSV